MNIFINCFARKVQYQERLTDSKPDGHHLLYFPDIQRADNLKF